MVGKWHLGNYRQPGHGFDHWVALHQGPHDGLLRQRRATPTARIQRVAGQHIVEHFSDRAIDYIPSPRPRPTVLPAGELRRPLRPAPDRRRRRPPQPILRTVRRPVVPAVPAHRRPAHPIPRRSVRLRPRPDRGVHAGQRLQQRLVDGTNPQRPGDPGQHRRPERAGRPRHRTGRRRTRRTRAHRGHARHHHDRPGQPLRPARPVGPPTWTDPPYIHDVTFRVPLIVRHPEPSSPSGSIDSVVSHYDLFPTILDHVGIDRRRHRRIAGPELRPAAAGRAPPRSGDEAFFEAETARAIRTPEFLYVAHLDGRGRARALRPRRRPRTVDERRRRDPRHATIVAALDARLADVLRRLTPTLATTSGTEEPAKPWCRDTSLQGAVRRRVGRDHGRGSGLHEVGPGSGE